MLQGLLMAALVAAGMPEETSEGSWEAEFRASRVHMNIRMDELPAVTLSKPTPRIAGRSMVLALVVSASVVC